MEDLKAGDLVKIKAHDLHDVVGRVGIVEEVQDMDGTKWVTIAAITCEGRGNGGGSMPVGALSRVTDPKWVAAKEVYEKDLALQIADATLGYQLRPGEEAVSRTEHERLIVEFRTQHPIPEDGSSDPLSVRMFYCYRCKREGEFASGRTCDRCDGSGCTFDNLVIRLTENDQIDDLLAEAGRLTQRGIEIDSEIRELNKKRDAQKQENEDG